MSRIAEQVADYYRSAGFSVTHSHSMTELSETLKMALTLCSDGRQVIGEYSHQWLGPKILGATPGQANLIAAAEFSIVPQNRQTELRHLDTAINQNSRAGYISGFHDIDGDNVHCGQQDKMRSGEVRRLPRQIYSPADAKARILAAGGQGVELLGGHKEEGVIVNLIENTTRVADGKYFMIDLWYILMVMKIPLRIAVPSSIEILRLLSPVQDVVVLS
jgi:hypothetical protein